MKPYIESEEDKVTYALFPKAAVEFFKKRKMQQEETKIGIPEERVRELEQAAAISVAVATYLKNLGGVKALVRARPKGEISPWVLAWRQNLAEIGA